MSTATIGPQANTQPIPAKKQAKSRKAPGIKQAVIERRLANKSKRAISNELGITRNTVTTILEESNVEQALLSNQQASVSLIPRALDVIDFRLSMNSENAAIKVLENTIWPLNQKPGKGMRAGDNLFLSIQNLIQSHPAKPLESAIECVPQDTQAVKPTK